MTNLQLTIELKSDTTFGRGDGVAGLVDEEIEYDPKTGLPFVKGRTLKGLLVEECANIFYSLNAMGGLTKDLENAAQWLFGSGGSSLGDGGHLFVGPGQLPEDLRKVVEAKIAGKVADNERKYTPSDILESLTTIRRQTAVNETRDVPEDGSLRSSRVLLRDITLTAELDFDQDPNNIQLALLAASVASVRRAGSGRNRGRGRVEMTLRGDTVSFDQRLKGFATLVEKDNVTTTQQNNGEAAK